MPSVSRHAHPTRAEPTPWSGTPIAPTKRHATSGTVSAPMPWVEKTSATARPRDADSADSEATVAESG